MENLHKITVLLSFISSKCISEALTDGVKFQFVYRYLRQNDNKIEEEVKEIEVWSGADPIVNWGYEPFEINSNTSYDNQIKLMKIFRRVAALIIINSKGEETKFKIPNGTPLHQFDNIPSGDGIKKIDEVSWQFSYFE